jgi:hypothetical protein
LITQAANLKADFYRRNTCRCCAGKELIKVLSLTPTPIGDEYVSASKRGIAQQSYPIDLHLCKSCGLSQILDVINPKILHERSTPPVVTKGAFSGHFKCYANIVCERSGLRDGDLAVDLGSHDNGNLAISLTHYTGNVLRVEPYDHIASFLSRNGVKTLSGFFGEAVNDEILCKYGRAKVVTANNLFANVDDIRSWIRWIKRLLEEDGVFVFETIYLADLINNFVFDFIYHEHLSTFSIQPLVSLFEEFDLNLVSVESVPTKGGSVRCYVKRKKSNVILSDGTVEKFLEYENSIGLHSEEIFDKFSKNIDILRDSTLLRLERANKSGKRIVGYGASVSCTTLIYHFQLGEYLEYLVDDNIAKHGHYSPGYHLPVYSPARLLDDCPDLVLILAWRFSERIIQKNVNYIARGGSFLVPLPVLKEVR